MPKDSHDYSAVIAALARGETAEFNPRGKSMQPYVLDGQLVTVAPLAREPKFGDIVLCTLDGKVLFHFVGHARPVGNGKAKEWAIMNGKGTLNGYVARGSIHGVKVA